MVTSSICTIGDEILIGQIVDTNSSHFARALNGIGVQVTRMVSFGDDRQVIISSLERELKENSIVIVTGGLGPTKDDITKPALAELSGSTGTRLDMEQLEIIHRILSSRGLDILDVNKAQAVVPDTCEVIPNRLGTAPIMVFRFSRERFGHECTLYSLPGVPYEATGAIPDIIKDIKEHYPTGDICHKTIMTYGLAESQLAGKIEAWENGLPDNIRLAYLPNPLTGVRLRLSIYGGARAADDALIETQLEKLRAIIGDYIYAEEDTDLQETIGRMLKKSGRTLSCAESCTGGMISHLITSVPGCSGYYLGSVTSYANSVKENVLGVPSEIIGKFGAVSSECVAKMAEGIKRITGSDYSVATSGIAGPDGGTPEKPVGTVWIGVCAPGRTETFKLVYKNDRKRNIERFAASALDILRKEILKDLSAL